MCVYCTIVYTSCIAFLAIVDSAARWMWMWMGGGGGVTYIHVHVYTFL